MTASGMIREKRAAGKVIRMTQGVFLGMKYKQKEITHYVKGFQNIGWFLVNQGRHKEGIIRQGITKWEFNIWLCRDQHRPRRG
jgi:hypothetical protein